MDKSELIKKFNSISKKCGVKNNNAYDVIVVDPPWNQGKTSKRSVRPNQTTKIDYQTLLLDEIKLFLTFIWEYYLKKNVSKLFLESLS